MIRETVVHRALPDGAVIVGHIEDYRGPRRFVPVESMGLSEGDQIIVETDTREVMSRADIQ